MVARNGGGHCRSRSKTRFSLKWFDFVVEDTMEDLHDRQMLVSDLEILAVHMDTAALILDGPI